MPAYIAITDAETDPEAPLTSELAKKWRDNPLAVAEASSAAPVNQGNWHPYNKVTNGDANTGRFYDFATDGALASDVTPDFVDGYEYLVIGRDVSHNNGVAANFQIEAFRETNAAYNPIQSITGAAATIRLNFRLYLPTVRQSINLHPFEFTHSIETTALANSVIAWNFTSSGNQFSTAQKVLRARFSWSGGSIDAGQMFLYRRKLIV
jgi:hypothetical protein